ncbi:MAG: exo-alpha-sialidase [Verrucomicrobiota bacterium]
MSLPEYSESLTRLAKGLVDQDAAKIIVEPQDRSSGYWFGGGNVVQAPDGSLLAVGRYRNYGDSRTGVGAGARGLELAIFRAEGVDGPWEKIVSWSKADLKCGDKEVVSIEGSSLLFGEDGVELFVSTEMDIPYSSEAADFQKPGTGVWTINRLAAADVAGLKESAVEEIFAGRDLAHLHVKDPTAFRRANGDTALIYCNHPYTWSSSNTSLAIRKAGTNEFEHVTDQMLQRGPVWDIAVTRVTDLMPVPKLGKLADAPDVSLYYYCGAEGLRQLDDNTLAVKRPRGWSCEEIGGVAFGVDSEFPTIDRLSIDEAFFTSPHGTGCSRYVSTVVLEDGIFTTWQQSQPDQSQPHVGHFTPMEKAAELLG